MTIPQIRGMYNGDRSRKQMLVEYGFRLPSALDNRPLKFEEFETAHGHAIYTSATPGPMRWGKPTRWWSRSSARPGWSIREVEVRPTQGQVDDLVGEIKQRTASGERVLVTTLTKAHVRGPGRLPDGAGHQGALPAFRGGDPGADRRSCATCAWAVFDVIVGINLLREGSGPAGSLAGGDPGCGQGRFSALGHRADPDDRAGGAACQRQGDHVCRPDHRFDEEGDRRDQPPPEKAG